MKKITLVTGLALVLALPALAAAKPTVDREDRRDAKAECKSLRGNTAATREAFLTQFRNLGACVRRTAVEDAQEEETAHKNAAKACKAQGLHGREFGKCVSTMAKEKESEADQEDQEEATEFKNAAKECAAERETNPNFAADYGRNANDKNAFGKCVSEKVREDEPEEPTGV